MRYLMNLLRGFACVLLAAIALLAGLTLVVTLLPLDKIAWKSARQRPRRRRRRPLASGQQPRGATKQGVFAARHTILGSTT